MHMPSMHPRGRRQSLGSHRAIYRGVEHTARPHEPFLTQACHWAINELKARVPIWKKEFYEGGEVWKENAESMQSRAQQR